MTSASEILDTIFSAEGLLKKCLKNFEARKEQQEMAQVILEAYEKNHHSLIEAGTGIGKSLAYLVPAVFWALKHQEKTVISTHTIALQEQLIRKDIPFLLKIMDADLQAVLVKGMSNYLCLRKLDELKEQLPIYTKEEQQELETIEAWATAAGEGCRSELAKPVSGSTWEKVGAEAENCTYNRCPHYKRCFFFRARREAAEAQILVVNHHLLCADLAIKQMKDAKVEGTVLPQYKRAVLDEAHHFEEVALESLSLRIDRVGLIRLLGKLYSDHQPLRSRLNLLRQSLSYAPRHLPQKEIASITQRVEMDLPAEKRNLVEKIEATFDALQEFCSMQLTELSQQELREQKWRLKENIFKDPLLQQNIKPIFRELSESLYRFAASLKGLVKDLEALKDAQFQESLAGHCAEIQSTSGRLEEMASAIGRFFEEDVNPHRVRWIESSLLPGRANMILVDANLDVSSYLKEAFFNRLSTASLCSATLSTNGHFQFVRQRLGLSDETERTISERVFYSPFDYKNRALLVIPNDLPLPTDPGFTASAAEAAFQAILASRGNAFVLFTSYDMLIAAYNLLLPRAKEHGLTLLRQGESARHALIDKFKSKEGSVLFGTDSFWEGVDVAGEALRCVILVKLPFRVPSDPLVQAQTEALVKQGKDPFFDYTVPQAVVKFKQGFGRLIRSKQDRGCIVCLDKRLTTKSYGKAFLKSLPSCRMVVLESDKAFEEMRDFYKKTRPSASQNN